MTCDKAKELFSELHEETLSVGLRQAAERHISECPACEHDYSIFRSVYGSIAPSQAVTPPAELGEVIARRLDKAEWDRKQARSGFRWSWAATAAAAAAVAVFAIFAKPWDGGVSSGPYTVPGAKEIRLSLRQGSILVSVPQGYDGELKVLQGGRDYSSLPPMDAEVVRTVQVRAERGYEVLLKPEANAPMIVWLSLEGRKPMAVISPSLSLSVENEVEGTLVEALQSVANRYGVHIEAIFAEAGESKKRDISGNNLAESLRNALAGTSLSASPAGGIVHIR